jgi:hypothetical protein
MRCHAAAKHEIGRPTMSNSTPEESWSRLGLFLSRDVMVRRYREHHGVVPEEGKAVEIISHLEQARQYFRSADTAGPLAGLQNFL